MQKFVVYILLLFSSSILFSQQSKMDMAFIEKADFKNKTYQERKAVYGFSKNPSKVSLYNPVYHILSGSMYVYQGFVSPQLSRQCMYNPSCSAYSKALIQDYGIVKGVFCTADRLSRCNRIAGAGLSIDAFDTHDHKVHETTGRYSLK